MFSIDDRDIKKLERDLKLFAKRAYPFAVKDTLNNTAKAATSFTKLNMQNDLTLRNRFTLGGMRTSFVRGLDVDRMRAVTGSLSDYMPELEFGGQKRSTGSQGTPLATSFAANEGKSKNRTKLPKGKKRLSKIKLRGRGKPGAGKREQLLVAVHEAVDSGNRDIFLDLGKTKGIFRVVGGSKKKTTRAGWPRGAKLRMLFDMSRKSVDIPANPVMGPAVIDAAKLTPTFYRLALEKQLRRQGLLV